MNNSSFTQIDDFTRMNNLVDVLDKRCRGFLKRDVLMSVVNRLDLKRQMVIDVVNEVVFTSQAKTRTIYYLEDGVLSNVRVQWARSLIGSVDFGREVIESNNGLESISESTPTKIITYPAIVLLEEQALGDSNITSTKLMIYI